MSEPTSFSLDWVFCGADTTVNAADQIGTIPDLPDGSGLVIGPESDDNPSWLAAFGADVVDDTAEFPGPTVFQLRGDPVDSDELPVPVVPAAAIPGLGSQALALGLLVESMPAVLSAMADGVVLVPVVLAQDWRMEVRLFKASAKAGPGDLCLFSSAETMERFLGEDSGAYFMVQRGAAVVGFLCRHPGEVTDLVFDPGGPNSLRIPAATMTGFLNTAQVEVAALEEVLSLESGPMAKGFDLRTGPDWGRVDCADPAQRDEQIQAVVEARTRNLPTADKESLNQDMRRSLTRAALNAAAVDGTAMFFLLTPDAVLNLVSYFHDLGPEKNGKTHLENLTESILGRTQPDKEVYEIEVSGQRMIRHTETGTVPRPEGPAPWLTIDYWIPAPDGRHMAHLNFSSPHAALKETITKLADTVAFNGVWVMEDEPDGAPRKQP